ncbi:D-alanine--D-alanine ligase [Candidatus Gottesmanbacteria bacterium]|nr:D-alanine--D-alanine ligase [Candidatus Gottesmanbacteria bacterium]
MVVGYCFNIKKNLPSADPLAQFDAEFDSPETITAQLKALESGNHRVIKIEADEKAYLKLFKLRKTLDIVFNIAEAFYGDARESQIPAMCDMLQIPYTFSSSLTHALKLDKAVAKKILSYHGIKTPRFQLFSHPDELLDASLRFPIILKPNAQGSSKGILDANLVTDNTNFKKRLKWMFGSFHELVLAEEFLDGREFTVSLMGNPPKVLPIIEQRLDRLPKGYAPFASYEVKWLWEDTLTDKRIAYDCPARLAPRLKKKIEHVSIATFLAFRCRDAARVDMRLDRRNEPHVLEINTLPGMMPDNLGVSYFPISARAAGYTYNQMILEILTLAAKRYNLV